jgi:tetratricopeptide (TPR) repeat protein
MSGNRVTITQAQLWCQQAISNQERGNYKEAKILLEEAIEVFRKENDEKDLASALSQLSQVLFRMNDFTATVKPLQESVTIRTRIGDYHGLSTDYQMMGNMLMVGDNLDEAEGWFRDGLGLAIGVDDRILISTALSNLGVVNYRKGKFGDAKKVFMESQEIRKALNDKVGIARNLNHLGKIEEDSGNFPEACHLYQESLTILQVEGAPDAGIALHNLINAQKKIKK